MRLKINELMQWDDCYDLQDGRRVITIKGIDYVGDSDGMVYKIINGCSHELPKYIAGNRRDYEDVIIGGNNVYVAWIIAYTYKLYDGCLNPMDYHLNHKDGNKLNNELENLEVTTRSENARHGYAIHRLWSKNIIPKGFKLSVSELSKYTALL